MGAPASPILRINHLSVRRGTARLLDDVSWQIQRGEHWIVLGANGSGKTSLLKAMMGFLTPSQGTMTLLDHRYGRADWRDVRSELGMVSSALQAHIPAAEPALETVISGRYAQLDFWGRATAEDVRAARRALRQLGATGLADRPWSWLSQGERQRVLIARALVAKPRLLILDEPCAGLDPVARTDFLGSVARLATGPRAPALIFVTHHVEEITAPFTHVLLLSQGRTIAAGPRDHVLTGANLSRTYGRPVVLRRRGEGYRLAVGGNGVAESSASRRVVPVRTSASRKPSV